MLAREVILEVRRLLDAGDLSHRAIGRKLEVSRGTVDAIANGQRGLHGREPEDHHLQLFVTMPERCPQCGGMVYRPCLLCQARAYRRREEQLSRLSGQPNRQQQVA